MMRTVARLLLKRVQLYGSGKNQVSKWMSAVNSRRSVRRRMRVNRWSLLVRGMDSLYNERKV